VVGHWWSVIGGNDAAVLHLTSGICRLLSTV
jgi:hypothetical protein